MAPGSRKRKASTDLEEDDDHVEDTAYSLPPDEQEDHADNHQTPEEDDFDKEFEDHFDEEQEYDGDEEKEDDFDEEQEDEFDHEQEDEFDLMQEDDDDEREVDDFTQHLDELLCGQDKQLLIAPEESYSLSDIYFTDNSEEEPLGKRPKLITHNIIIEHCTSPICNTILQYKAIEVKAALERGVPNAAVEINPFTPISRINHFEVRIEGGPVIISFKDLRRPFLEVVDLNMKELLETAKLKMASMYKLKCQ